MRTRRAQGFTLVEVMVVVAIVTVLAALAIAGLQRAQGVSRTSSAKLAVLSSFNVARQRAIARGSDVYVIFSNLESTATYPPSATARVLVYDDPTFVLRGFATDLMAHVDDANIASELSSAGSVFGASGLTFVRLDNANNPVLTPSCVPAGATLPPYLAVTSDRLTKQNCKAWCTFCEIQKTQCIGAVRFTADGQAKVVTGPTNGRGGLISLVVTADTDRSSCIAITEPSGLAQAF